MPVDVYDISLADAITVVLGILAPLVVSIVRRIGPDTTGARWVTVLVCMILGVLASYSVGALDLSPTEKIEDWFTRVAVIVMASQAVYNLYKPYLDGLAGKSKGSVSELVE